MKVNIHSTPIGASSGWILSLSLVLAIGALLPQESNAQAAKEVTGSISSRIDEGSASPVYTEILDGKVEGDTITFYVWTGLDRPVKAYYEGTLSGEEIKFTVTGGAAESGGLAGPGAGAGQSAQRQVTAKRAK